MMSERPRASGSSVGSAAKAPPKQAQSASALAVEARAGGMVRAMDLRVAVAAVAVHRALVRARAARQVGARHQVGGVEHVRVALLAEERARDREQALVARAVRHVAAEAVLAHRRVLPDERAALLRVAAVAQLVHRIGLEQPARARAV